MLADQGHTNSQKYGVTEYTTVRLLHVISIINALSRFKSLSKAKVVVNVEF
jgi:hypothetical protein